MYRDLDPAMADTLSGAYAAAGSGGGPTDRPCRYGCPTPDYLHPAATGNYRDGCATLLRNLTPHPIVLHTGHPVSPTKTWPAEDGPRPRVQVDRRAGRPLRTLRGDIPTTITSTGRLVDLPDPQPHTVLIVSRIVAEAAPDRDDLVFPDDLVRDTEGRVIGCRAFARIA
jgi:hypothetical protein